MLFTKMLVTEIGQLVDQVRPIHGEVPIREKLLMTIWWLAHEGGYIEVSDRFNTTEGIPICIVQFIILF